MPRTDAKNQRAVYTYDAYQELIQVARGTVSNGVFTEDVSQRTTYTYGAAGAPNATAGRVATIQYSGPTNSGIQFTETYGYVAAGGVSSKALGIQGPLSTTLTGTWAYDSEGRVTTVTYPEISNTNSNPAAAYTYAFDSMGRLNTMTDQNNATLVSGVTYNGANQILSMVGTLNETRTYNANLQLIELVSGSYHYKYNYSANQNNGRITSMNDVISGEVITYQYDSLNWLINASGTGYPQGSWSQAFTYDGFGNLSQKNGSNAPALSVAIDATTNRMTTNGAGYDANGSLTAYGTGVFAATYSYDVENRLNSATVSGASYGYGYDSLNERVFSGTLSGSTYTNELIYFYGADGKKLGVWSYSASAIQNVSVNQWFAGRLLKGEDRLQSVGKYFPYGEDRNNPNPPNPANDQEKFATYTRDSATGLDYAMNRYYNSAIARFMTTDPYQPSAHPGHPQSWNRYAYVDGDPVGGLDPTGLFLPAGGFEGEGFEWGYLPNPYAGYGPPPVMPAPPPAGGGGAPAKLVVNNLSKSGKKYNQVVKTLQEILAEVDPDCLSFLQSGGFNLKQTVSQLLSANMLAVGDFAINIAAFEGTAGTNLPPGTASIVVNNGGAFFNSSYFVDEGRIQGGTGKADAFILLHELGHLLEAKGFQPDLNNAKAGTSNDALIAQHCQKTLNLFK